MAFSTFKGLMASTYQSGNGGGGGSGGGGGTATTPTINTPNFIYDQVGSSAIQNLPFKNYSASSVLTYGTNTGNYLQCFLTGPQTAGASVKVLAKTPSNSTTGPTIQRISMDAMDSQNFVWINTTSANNSVYVGSGNRASDNSAITLYNQTQILATPSSTASTIDICSIDNTYFLASYIVGTTLTLSMMNLSGTTIGQNTSTTATVASNANGAFASVALSTSLVGYARADTSAGSGSSTGNIYVGVINIQTGSSATISFNAGVRVPITTATSSTNITYPVVAQIDSTRMLVSWYEYNSNTNPSVVNYGYVVATLSANGSVSFGAITYQPVYQNNVSNTGKRYYLDLNSRIMISHGSSSTASDQSQNAYYLTFSGNSITVSTPVNIGGSFGNGTRVFPASYDGYNYVMSFFTGSLVYNNASNYDQVGITYITNGGQPTWASTYTGSLYNNNVALSSATASNSTLANSHGACSGDPYSLFGGYTDTGGGLTLYSLAMPYNLAARVSNTRDTSQTWGGKVNILYGTLSFLFTALAGSALVAGPVYNNIGNAGTSSSSSVTLASSPLNSFTSICTSPVAAVDSVTGYMGKWMVFYSTSAGLMGSYLYVTASGNAPQILYQNQSLVTYTNAQAANTLVNSCYLTPGKILVASSYYNTGGVGTHSLFICSYTNSSMAAGTSVTPPVSPAPTSLPQIAMLTSTVGIYTALNSSGAIIAYPFTVSGSTISFGSSSVSVATGQSTTANNGAIGNNQCMVAISQTEAMLYYAGKYVIITNNNGTLSVGTAYSSGATQTNNPVLVNTGGSRVTSVANFNSTSININHTNRV